jgi:diguanylate cyclase (GGDEF)-like protein
VTAPAGLTPGSTVVNPHVLAGSAAFVIAALLLFVYLYRRRPFILWWIGAWVLMAGSMIAEAAPSNGETIGGMIYGISQFLGVVSALAFVVAADAYRQRPRLTRTHGLVLLPVAIFCIFLPVALERPIVSVLGHLLIAGGMATAAAAHLLLLRQARLLGASIVGAALFTLAGLNIWMGVVATRPDSAAVAPVLISMTVVFLIGGLGMQLMTFEDMTYELRQTNRRLEAAQSDLRQLAITDALTGMRNRRFFYEIIGRELQRHRRYGTPLSIVFIDIDKFKAINDTLGHETGDRVLKEVATFLLRHIREADYVFRWGGDEFLVLISCNEAEACRRGAALQDAFAKSPQLETLPSGVALSIGCVEVPEETEDIMPHVQLADERMYQDKNRRRSTTYD